MNGVLPMIFADPAIAATTAKMYSKRLGEKLCVKAVIDVAWKKREQNRMIRGEYRLLPWVLTKQPWWHSDAAHAVWVNHFPHAALEKPGWIAYTKNEEDGTKDKQSLLRPGAYLNRYFKQAMEAYGISEKACVDAFNKMYGPVDVNFAATEEEILKVYSHGPQTCLHDDRDYPKGIHPASVYAAGDLQIAYLGNIDGKVSARTLVWPAKKIHSRVYGDIARLTQGLERLGYKWGAPVGAKLKRIPLRPVNMNRGDVPMGCFLVPYLDRKNQQGGGHLGVKDMGDHLIITHDGKAGTHHAGNPDGTSGPYVPRNDEYPMFDCVKCGEKYREVVQVYTENPNDDGDFEDSDSYCHECAAKYTHVCQYSGNNFTANCDLVPVNGALWLRYYADMYAAKCEGTGKLFNADDLHSVNFADGTCKRLSSDYVRKLGGFFRSDASNRLYLIIDRTDLFESLRTVYHCAKSELRDHAFQCDGCDSQWMIAQRQQPFGDDRLYCPICIHTIRKDKRTPVSASRRNFELARDQHVLPLIAAE
jgi:hypothetical protein